MDVRKLFNEPPASIILHEAEVEKLDITENAIELKLKLGHSVYLWNKDVFKDIFVDPVNNKLILGLIFKGVKMDRMILSNDFVLNEELAIINNDFDEETKVLNIGFEDNSLHYMDLFFRYASYEWVYIDEVKAV